MTAVCAHKGGGKQKSRKAEKHNGIVQLRLQLQLGITRIEGKIGIGLK